MFHTSRPGCPSRPAVFLLGLVLVATATAQPAATSYQGPVLPAETLPAWEARRDPGSPVVLSETGNAVLFFQDRHLVAADAVSGATLWTFADGGTSLVAHRNRVFVAKPRSVVALEISTGQEVWRTTLESDAFSIVNLVFADAGVLIVHTYSSSLRQDGGVALSLADGTERYTLPGRPLPGGIPAPLHGVRDDIVASVSVSGRQVAGVPGLFLHDLATGETKFSIFGVSAVLWMQDGKVYLEDAGYERQTFQTPWPDRRIIVVDESSGEVDDIWSYNPSGPLARREIIAMTAEAVFQRIGSGTVLKYPWGGATEPISRAGPFDADGVGTGFLAGPYRDHLFFESRTSELIAVRASEPVMVEDGTWFVEAPVLEPDLIVQGAAPISRLDLFGDCAFVGRTDGSFEVAEVPFGRGIVLRARFPPGGFEGIVAHGAAIVVMTPARLHVLSTPADRNRATYPDPCF